MNIKIDVFERQMYNKKIIKECEKIVDSHHVSNGGMLKYKGLVGRSDMLVTARDEQDNIVGFVALVKDFYGIRDIYVYQIAVSKDCLKQGVGNQMIGFIKENIKGYYYLTADVRKDNVPSNHLFSKLGFTKKVRDASRDSDFYIFDFQRNLDKDVTSSIKR
jgi:ribosomal protein S18 acetylase RimI-like enzyme